MDKPPFSLTSSKPYGTVEWNESARVASLTFPIPVVEEPPAIVSPPVITRRTTNLDPEASMLNHKPIDKANMPEHISVGLLFDETAVPMLQLTSPDGFVVGEFNQEFIMMFQLRDSNRIQLHKDDHYYLGMTRPYPSIKDAEEELTQIRKDGHKAALAIEVRDWNIYIGPFSSRHEALNYLIDERLEDRDWTLVNPTYTRIRAENQNGNPVFIYDTNTQPYIASSAAANDPYASIVQVNQTRYRGMIGAVRMPAQNLTVINRLPLEQYLYGVVPKEMPHSWNIEALKAQAVAARGFALANVGKLQSKGFDVCTTVNTQVYGGYSSEQTSTNQAVDQTAGKIMSYLGKLIIPYYHSSSGGQTESSEYIWQRGAALCKRSGRSFLNECA
jgi:stage II sporulation protein D